MVIVSRSKRNLEEVVTRLDEKARRKAMQINESKTKYMSWTDQKFVGGQNLSIRTEREEIYKFDEV